jgi:hypothetical protein
MGAMQIVTLAVTIIIGAVVVGLVYSSIDLTTIPDSAETSINNTITQTNSGFTLLAVAIIVGAAVFILAVLGGRN